MIYIDLHISLTAQEQAAWVLIKPKLKAYAAKILTVYRLAPDAKKAELRAHNAVLDQLLDMLGE